MHRAGKRAIGSVAHGPDGTLFGTNDFTDAALVSVERLAERRQAASVGVGPATRTTNDIAIILLARLQKEKRAI